MTPSPECGGKSQRKPTKRQNLSGSHCTVSTEMPFHRSRLWQEETTSSVNNDLSFLQGYPNMKKIMALTAALVAASTLLAGCDNAEQARKERCTELRGEASKAFDGEGTRKNSEIKKDWDKNQCKESDIIQG